MEYKASVFYTAGEVQYTFPFNYLKKRFVKVQYQHADGTFESLNYGTDYTIESKTVVLSAAGSSADVIHIYRETPTDQIVSFVDASVLKAYDLNVYQIQLLHLAEENADNLIKQSLSLNSLYNYYDAKGRRIVNVGDPVGEQDAINYRYFWETAEGVGVSVKEAQKEAQNAKISALDSARYAADSAYSANAAEDYSKAARESANDADAAAMRAAESQVASINNMVSRAESAVAAINAYAVPAWNASTVYSYPDVVSYSDGQTYRCIGENVPAGTTPPSSPLWVRITTRGGDDFWDIDVWGGYMPAEDPTASYSWELDENGGIMPRIASDNTGREAKTVAEEALEAANAATEAAEEATAAANALIAATPMEIDSDGNVTPVAIPVSEDDSEESEEP